MTKAEKAQFKNLQADIKRRVMMAKYAMSDTETVVKNLAEKYWKNSLPEQLKGKQHKCDVWEDLKQFDEIMCESLRGIYAKNDFLVGNLKYIYGSIERILLR